MTAPVQCGPEAPVVRYDLRADRVPSKPKISMRGRAPVVRDPSSVTGIVVHQTAVEFGLDKRGAMLRAAGGDRNLALARRALQVAGHAVAFRPGLAVLSAPLRWQVVHGNAFNAYTLGLEIDGLYPGLRDDPDTLPREDLETTAGEPTEVTPLLVAAARDAIRWLVEAGRAEGMPIADVYAHRQSNRSRRADPGQELWETVVEGYAIPVLGLRPHYTVALPSRLRGKPNNGRPVPTAWARGGVGAY